MKELEILIVGKHPDIMKTILRLINNKPGWKGSGAFTVEETLTLSKTIIFDVVLLGAGLSESESGQIKAHFTVPVVQHYGGGSGLLYAEIYEAVAS